MHKNVGKPVYYFQADASTVGGVLQAPEQRYIPSQASVSLPAVGGESTAQSGAFNLDRIVSVKSAYARVTGEVTDENGSVLTTVSSTVEGLNILDVVTAERLVSKLTVQGPVEYLDGRLVVKERRISVAGSEFVGLRVTGSQNEVTPILNATLLPTNCERQDARNSAQDWQTYQQVGVRQAEHLVADIDGGQHGNLAWLRDRYGWMAWNDPTDGLALCSVVDRLGERMPSALGHVLDIPNIGRFFFGELIVSPLSVQLTMIRAELGCAVHGGITAAITHSNGTTVPPGK